MKSVYRKETRKGGSTIHSILWIRNRAIVWRKEQKRIRHCGAFKVYRGDFVDELELNSIINEINLTTTERVSAHNRETQLTDQWCSGVKRGSSAEMGGALQGV